MAVADLGDDGGTVGPDMTPPPKAQGASCTMNSECGSPGGCVDGRCCDTTCTDSCKACNVSGKEGTCTPIASGLMPQTGHPACGPDPKSSCQRDGTCDGVGACHKWPLGTVCQTGTCNAGTNMVTSDSTCNGNGTCSPGTTITCARTFASRAQTSAGRPARATPSARAATSATAPRAGRSRSDRTARPPPTARTVPTAWPTVSTASAATRRAPAPVSTARCRRPKEPARSFQQDRIPAPFVRWARAATRSARRAAAPERAWPAGTPPKTRHASARARPTPPPTRPATHRAPALKQPGAPRAAPMRACSAAAEPRRLATPCAIRTVTATSRTTDVTRPRDSVPWSWEGIAAPEPTVNPGRAPQKESAAREHAQVSAKRVAPLAYATQSAVRHAHRAPPALRIRAIQFATVAAPVAQRPAAIRRRRASRLHACRIFSRDTCRSIGPA